MTERACEKCGGTDLLIRFKRAGGIVVSWGFGDDIRRKDPPRGVELYGYHGYFSATRDLLHVHCRTCQWWWTEEPKDARPPLTPSETNAAEAG